MPTVPTLSELETALGDDISETLYNRYFVPYLEYIYSRSPDAVFIEEELFDQLSVDFSKQTYRNYIREIIRFDQSLERRIVGRVYVVDAFIAQSAKGHGLNDVGKYINIVQWTCLTEYRKSKDEYAHRLIRYLREKVEKSYSSELNDDRVDSDIVVSLLGEYTAELTKVVPPKVTSINQSGKNMSGTVNEALFYLALESTGLVKGTDFIDMSGGADTGDIRVFCQDTSCDAFNVEAKSTGSRERSAFGVSSVDDPSGLIGFFNEPSEMVQQADKLDNGCQVVYLPPYTLAQVAQRDRGVYEMTSSETGELLFRANNEFGSDMKYYHENGELPSKDVGHESLYLRSTWGSASQ